MKFDVTLAIVLVFLAPGMIVLSASPMHTTEPLDALRSLEKIPSASELLVLLSVAFLVGVALDSLREPLNKYQKWLYSVYTNRLQTETRPLSPFFIAHGAMFAPFGVL